MPKLLWFPPKSTTGVVNTAMDLLTKTLMPKKTKKSHTHPSNESSEDDDDSSSSSEDSEGDEYGVGRDARKG